MKALSIALLVLSLFLSVSVVWANSEDKETFFRNAIDQEIQKCLLKAPLAESTGDNSRLYGEKTLDQAAFYQAHKEELVEAMMREGIQAKLYKVHYSLIQAYKDSERILAER